MLTCAPVVPRSGVAGIDPYEMLLLAEAGAELSGRHLNRRGIEAYADGIGTLARPIAHLNAVNARTPYRYGPCGGTSVPYVRGAGNARVQKEHLTIAEHRIWPKFHDRRRYELHHGVIRRRTTDVVGEGDRIRSTLLHLDRTAGSAIAPYVGHLIDTRIEGDTLADAPCRILQQVRGQ